jgi:elongation factor P
MPTGQWKLISLNSLFFIEGNVMGQISTSDFKAGLKIEIEKQPYVIVSNQFVKPGKGQAFNRTRIKNLFTGRTIEKTFKSGDTVDEADVQEAQMRLLYIDQEGATFMDDDSYEQVAIPEDKLQDVKQWLVEDQVYALIFYKGEALSVEPPTFMEMEITQTAPGVRGDTASGRVLKPATTNTGAQVQIPIFIEQGEVIKIDTRTGEYVSRVNK